jgi:hypothetical protein
MFGLRTAMALGLVVGSVACASTSVTRSADPWSAVPGLGPGTSRVVAMATSPSGAIAVGSVTTNGARVPALWRSGDGRAWQRLQVTPASPYGFESELTTVAATSDGKVAAIGQAVGGTHGNPRVGSWYLDGTTLREVVGPVELYGGPRQGSVGPMAAGRSGFVVIGTRTDHGNDRTGAAAWTSSDARDDFNLVDTDPALQSGPGETVRGLTVAGSDRGYVAGGDRAVDGHLDDEALIWTSPDGQHWTRVPAAAADVGGPGDQLAQAATGWGDGWAVAGLETLNGRTGVLVWTTPDGVRWQRARVDAAGTDPDPLSAITSIVAVDGRLLVAARLGTRYVLASSGDGVTWRRVPVPAGAVPDAHGVLVLAPVAGGVAVGATSDAGTHLWWAPVTALA